MEAPPQGTLVQRQICPLDSPGGSLRTSWRCRRWQGRTSLGCKRLQENAIRKAASGATFSWPFTLQQPCQLPSNVNSWSEDRLSANKVTLRQSVRAALGGGGRETKQLPSDVDTLFQMFLYGF